MVERAAGRLPWAALLPWLVAAGVYLVVLVLGNKLLHDPDTYWHIAVGEWLVGHGTFPHADPFSSTFAGQPWIAKEWLSQLIYLGAYDLAGWSGPVVVAAACLALAFGLLAGLLQRDLGPIPTLFLLVAAFVLAAPHAAARPHVLALPVMVAWVGGLVAAVDNRRGPPFKLLPLMVLWANLHGSFTLGILFAAAIGLDAVAAAPADARSRVGLRWAGFALAALLAGCITPYGPESILVTFRILGLGPALSVIAEWQPQGFDRPGAFELCLLLGLGFALYRGLVLPPVRILILLGLLHLALSAARHAEILGFLAPLLVARPLATQFPDLRPANGRRRGGEEAIAAAAIIAALIPATLATGSLAVFAPAADITPAAAVAAMKRADPGPVLNDYGFGGYLIFAGVPPFIDGRTELYGADFVLSHRRAVTLADLGEFIRLLDRYKIGASLLAPTTPAVQFLDRDPGWRRLYADDVAVVHVRR